MHILSLFSLPHTLSHTRLLFLSHTLSYVYLTPTHHLSVCLTLNHSQPHTIFFLFLSSPPCSCCVTPDAELTLLAFALARGSVAKILQSLSGISEHLEAEYRASSLISSMASVRLRLLYRNGNLNQPHLQYPCPSLQPTPLTLSTMSLMQVLSGHFHPYH